MKAFDSEKLKELFSNFVDESYSKIDDNEDCNTIIDQLVIEIDELKKAEEAFQLKFENLCSIVNANSIKKEIEFNAKIAELTFSIKSLRQELDDFKSYTFIDNK